MAEWLDRVFYGFDSKILEWMHRLHNSAGGFFKGFFSFISMLGNSGWFFLLLAVIFLFFAKTRKAGIAMAVAIAIGAIITNLCLKNIIARERPYANPDFFKWWQDAGGHTETDYSFPSGHVTSAFSSMTAFFIFNNKKWSWTGFVFGLLMALSRIYLMVHYPTDVIAGIIVGLIAGGIGAVVTHVLYRKTKGKFNKFLTEWDIIKVFKKKKEEKHKA